MFGAALSRFGPTANAAIYIDAAGVEPILELYQSMGKIESRTESTAQRTKLLYNFTTGCFSASSFKSAIAANICLVSIFPNPLSAIDFLGGFGFRESQF